MPDPHQLTRNARYGLVLFGVYVVLYALFVVLSAFRPDVMSSKPIGGVNLAVLYGLGLILMALVLAVIYMAICGMGNDRDEPTDREEHRP